MNITEPLKYALVVGDVSPWEASQPPCPPTREEVMAYYVRCIERADTPEFKREFCKELIKVAMLPPGSVLSDAVLKVDFSGAVELLREASYFLDLMAPDRHEVIILQERIHRLIDVVPIMKKVR